MADRIRIANYRANCLTTELYFGNVTLRQDVASFFWSDIMRHHYDRPSIYLSMYGETYICDHPVYNHCTLFIIGERGLAVIQQRFNPNDKSTYWTEIDPWLCDELYLHPRFKEYFDEHADFESGGLFPTSTVRQIMWGLKMKPLPREVWETSFDRRDI